MKKFITTLKNIWSIEELRNKILYTLLLLFIYRLGSFIVIPGIDPNKLDALHSSTQNSGMLGLLDAFVGGAFSKASIFALGIMPYISASIFMQLVTILVPQMAKIQKEGESGRKKITQLTRYSICSLYWLFKKPGKCRRFNTWLRCSIFLGFYRSVAHSRYIICNVAGRKNYRQRFR